MTDLPNPSPHHPVFSDADHLPAHDAAKDPVLWRRVTIMRLRIASGLVLFLFATTHFLNHALGLISLEAMQAGQDFRLPITRSLAGMTVLITATAIHFGLGLWTLIRVRTWRLGPRSLLQLLFGLLIPVLLIRHVLGTRGVAEMFGIDDSYAYALAVMWPGEAWNQAFLMTLVWVHGCIGLHHWLATRMWYQRWLWVWYGAALLIPSLGYAGFVTAARVNLTQTRYVSPLTAEQFAHVQKTFAVSGMAYYTIIAAAVGVWLLVLLAGRFSPRISVAYANGPTVAAAKGLSVLDISRMNRIPHAAVCGGRARCSTCRVRVIEGMEKLPAVSAAEAMVLRRVGAPWNVRLACQLRPTADLRLSTLLPADMNAEQNARADKYHWGVEQTVTIMFCDLRGFTRISEGRLSYDVVFLLNQFLGRMSEAIEDTGGFVDKFMGDGIMAIFGMDEPVEAGATKALAAARAMGGVMDSLNASLRDELRAPLSMGIGLHTGPAILGRIGASQRNESVARLTALGETVNIASRLETKTKELGVQLALSASTMAAAGATVTDKMTPLAVDLRGLSQPIDIFIVARAADLSEPAPT
ncbi:MAG: adenylate/guanylate cyclase domain-containing protein [Pseudomonadota bacterium]